MGNKKLVIYWKPCETYPEGNIEICKPDLEIIGVCYRLKKRGELVYFIGEIASLGAIFASRLRSVLRKCKQGWECLAHGEVASLQAAGRKPMVVEAPIKLKCRCPECEGSKSIVELNDDSYDLADVEKRTIMQALKATEGNKTIAAGILKITRRTLYNKLDDYGLEEYCKGL